MIPEHRWIFRARVERIIDGDTFDVLIDQGYHNERLERLRLIGLNTPEKYGDTKIAGLAATQYTHYWLAEAGLTDWPLTIETFKADSFGRYLARVWRSVDGACLNDDLLSSGNAKVYP